MVQDTFFIKARDGSHAIASSLRCMRRVSKWRSAQWTIGTGVDPERLRTERWHSCSSWRKQWLILLACGVHDHKVTCSGLLVYGKDVSMLVEAVVSPWESPSLTSRRAPSMTPRRGGTPSGRPAVFVDESAESIDPFNGGFGIACGLEGDRSVAIDTARRTGGVVESAELAHPALPRGGGAPDERPVQALRRAVPHRSTKAFAVGARTGVLKVRVPWVAKTVSKAAVNLVSRCRIKNLKRRSWSSRVMARFRAA
jgi:hypothetical protein